MNTSPRNTDLDIEEDLVGLYFSETQKLEIAKMVLDVLKLGFKYMKMSKEEMQFDNDDVNLSTVIGVGVTALTWNLMLKLADELTQEEAALAWLLADTIADEMLPSLETMFKKPPTQEE
jgi:hypothetical protein